MSCHIAQLVCIVIFCYNLGQAYDLCCLDGWTSFNGSCYFFGHHDLDFQEAERFCAHYGAHLTTIETKFENTFLKSHLANLKDINHWIGLTDEIVENAWKWYSTDSSATFTDWGTGQPNNGRGGNCGAIWATFQYQWVDEPCTNLFKPLCEKKMNPELDVIGK